MDHWRRKNKQRLALPILEVWRPSRQEVPSPDIFMELYQARYIEIAVVVILEERVSLPPGGL
jgi:hypothetical protein